MAIIIDIRRDNLLNHLLFKSLFHKARNRVEYMCLLFGKPFPKTRGWEKKGIAELVEYIDGVQTDPRVVEKTRGDIRREVQKFGFTLSQSDLDAIARVHQAFVSWGLEIRYSSHQRPSRSIYPAYRDLLLERDLTGQFQNYLHQEEDYQFLKRLQEQDLIVPVVGDLSGPKAVKAIGSYVAEIRERVSAFYASNVEFYVYRQGNYGNFIDNLRALPLDDRSVLIRSYFNYSAPLHPQTESGHFSTQLLQRIRDLLAQCEAGGCNSYMDVVTRNSLLLR